MLGPPKVRDLDRPALVSLEALVPRDHFYRRLDATLDLDSVRDWVRDRYAARGRPSIDPVVFFRLQLIMFFEGIRSERQLMAQASLNLAHRWYLGYHLDEPLPDHSSLTRIRERYGVETFRRFFEAIVERCIVAGLVWREELYLDATKVDANAALGSAAPRFAVEAHLAELFSGGAAGDAATAASDGTASDTIAPTPLPVATPATVLEEVADANAARHDWLAATGRPDRTVTRGHYQRRSDYTASRTDPDAALMQRRGGGAHFGYHDHYLVDGGKARIILGVLATPADVMENQPALDLIWRARSRWRLRPRQVTGDTTYGTLENIVALEDQGIRAYLPLPDFDSRTELFGKGAFRYDPERDAYICPRGELLPVNSRTYALRLIRYRAAPDTCNACPLKARCTTSDRRREIARNFDEHYLDRVRGYHETEAYRKVMRKRQVWVEPLFAEAKDWHGLRRFRLRGLKDVNMEALVKAAGQNLKRLVSWRGWGRRPWPGGAAGLRLDPDPVGATT
ncbi:MAG: IS1182 family transposase [Chloroflexota bacterium]|nr:IS1182 family transposase [Chloroflexota bacterium]